MKICDPYDFFDLVKIGGGIIAGIFLSTVTFLLTYRNSWRNKLTKELTVSLKFNKKSTYGDSPHLNLRYYINNTTGIELSINSAFLELPNGLPGNVGPNSTYGEMLFGKGRYYIFKESKNMTHHLSDEFSIDNKDVLDSLVNRKVKKTRLILNTSRYGQVKSKYCKI